MSTRSPGTAACWPVPGSGAGCPRTCTAVGKAILALSPPSAVEMVLAAGLVPRTAFSITAGSVLRKQLARAAREGVAFEREESDLGVTCAASPVEAFGRQVVAALSVTGPVGRLQPERFAPTVRLAALALSRRLGARAPSLAGLDPVASS